MADYNRNSLSWIRRAIESYTQPQQDGGLAVADKPSKLQIPILDERGLGHLELEREQGDGGFVFFDDGTLDPRILQQIRDRVPNVSVYRAANYVPYEERQKREGKA